MPRPLALSGLAVAVPTQMLLRRYTIEIWPLQRMVKLYLPIAGETGGADKLDDSKVRGWRCEARRASHLSLFVAPVGHTGNGRDTGREAGHGRRQDTVRSPHRLNADVRSSTGGPARAMGWGPAPLRARPAPRRGSRAGRCQQLDQHNVRARARVSKNSVVSRFSGRGEAPGTARVRVWPAPGPMRHTVFARSRHLASLSQLQPEPNMGLERCYKR